MSKKYPHTYGYRRKPDPDKDGSDNYGKPCVVCRTPTCGEVWIRHSFMRGEDEAVRVCAKCWELPGTEIINNIEEQESHS